MEEVEKDSIVEENSLMHSQNVIFGKKNSHVEEDCWFKGKP